MENETPNSEVTWVDDQMAKLSLPKAWHPDTDRAFEKLLKRKQAQGSPLWIRASLAAAILVAMSLVIAMLPWHMLRSQSNGNRNRVAEPVKPAIPAVGQPVAPVPVPPARPQTPPSSQAVQPPAAPAQEQEEKPAGNVLKGVTAPKALSTFAPSYTDEAREAHIQGAVQLSVLVRADGSAKVTKVLEGLGYGLDENAIAAAEQMKYKPGTVDGVPQDFQLQIGIRFHLY